MTTKDRLRQLWSTYCYCRVEMDAGRYDALRLALAMLGSTSFIAHLVAMRKEMRGDN